MGGGYNAPVAESGLKIYMRIRFKAELKELDSGLRIERLRKVEGVAPEGEPYDTNGVRV